MKLHHCTALLGGLLFTSLLAGLLAQHRQLGRTRDELAKRETPLPAVVSAPEPAPSIVPEPPLTEAELRELLTLRGEVGRLRQEKSKLAALEAENARLQSALTKTASGADRIPVPEGYLAPSEAQFAGFATPADALQSFLWAVRNRDTNALFQVLAPSSAEEMARALSQQGADSFFENLRLPGFFIKSLEENADGTAAAELQFDPNSSELNMKFPLQRDEQGAWRFAFYGGTPSELGTLP